MKKHQSGFTLIEISIVLVIVGLLLGGVLKGQAMIDSAKYKAWAKEMDGYRAAVNMFQDRYKALPGDMTAAGISKLPVIPGVTYRVGNGNGLIEGGGCTSNCEASAAIQHMIGAGLISGDATATTSMKTTPVGGALYSISTGNWANNRMKTKLLYYNVPAEYAKRLDEETDDGNAATGTVARYGATTWPTDNSALVNVFVEI